MPDDEWWPSTPDVPTVWDDDPNPIVGVILGPDGEPLIEVRTRPPVPFGFAPPDPT